MRLKFYLDTRRETLSGLNPLRLCLRNGTKTRLLNLDLRLRKSQWLPEESLIVRHPNARNLNQRLQEIFYTATEALHTAALKAYGDDIELCADCIENALRGVPDIEATFAHQLEKYAETCTGRTKDCYTLTLSRIKAFDDGWERLTFDDIDADWLERFDRFLAKSARGTSRNGRNVRLRNIKTIFNAAITDEITTKYPFRRFKIRNSPTRKRALTVSQLRELWDYPCEPWQQKYLDAFKLIFCLIGINVVDLSRLEKITEDGRIEYARSKTSRQFSIKVEPETMELIERLRGTKKLLNICDTYSDHTNYISHINHALKTLGKREKLPGRGGPISTTPTFPGLTTYWARHTWATIAASLDISKETIAQALGHGGHSVTDIYIDFDWRKVDVANRRVLDWVLYHKQ